ncbi:MAG: mechanosensitive ion channel family protein [Gemmatimonadota bacterium]
MNALRTIADGWPVMAWAAALLVGAALVGFLAHRLLFAALPRLLRSTPTGLDEALLRRLRRPSRLLFPLLAVRPVLGTLATPDARWIGDVAQGVTIALILAVTWTVIATVRAVAEWLRSQHDVTVADNLRARRVHTQVDVLATALVIVIAMVGGAIALMQFPQVRELGASLLASAGIAGIVVGFAARPVLSNLIAGVQLAFTEPIRLDDVVVVEGEWGRIEDITSTYVVVKIWDERRLVLPVSYFLEHPFQNWTRETADVLGTVFLYLDWRVPVDRIRSKLQELCEANEYWDGRVAGVQVTNTSAEAVEVRCLVSGSDASKLWTLRCDVREGLVAYLQDEYPESLPVVRAEMRRVGDASAPAG